MERTDRLSDEALAALQKMEEPTLTHDFAGGKVRVTFTTNNGDQVARVRWHEEGPRLTHVVENVDGAGLDPESSLKSKIREACIDLFNVQHRPLDAVSNNFPEALSYGNAFRAAEDLFEMMELKPDEERIIEFGRLTLRMDVSGRVESICLRSKEDASFLRLIYKRKEHEDGEIYLHPADNEPIFFSEGSGLKNPALRAILVALAEAKTQFERKIALQKARSYLRAAMLEDYQASSLAVMSEDPQAALAQY